jgi:hypothetical protein
MSGADRRDEVTEKGLSRCMFVSFSLDYLYSILLNDYIYVEIMPTS